MIISIGSLNKAKYQATQNAFTDLFPNKNFILQTCSVSSNIPEQPLSDEETLQGATNRAQNALSAINKAHIAVGIESGVEWFGNELAAFTWAVIISKKEEISKGRSPTYFLPPLIAHHIKNGLSLMEARKLVFPNIPIEKNDGIISVFTDDKTTRTHQTYHALLMALIPFKNRNLFNKNF